MSQRIQKIKEKLQIIGAQPKKSLGQNFLISDRVIEVIVSKVKSYNPESIIEIGPGLGSLTEDLLNLNIPMTLIELDRGFAESWRLKFTESQSEQMTQQFKNTCIEADALQWDWNTITNKSKKVLVSNLPYQISSSIVIDRSTVDDSAFQAMILMFQKEVAQRLMAKPKTSEYGLLTVVAQSFWKIQTLCEAGPRDFYPPPNVASRVLFFEPLDLSMTMEIQEKQKFLKFVKVAFSQRRKMLISNLQALGNINIEQLQKIFNSLNLNIKSRAEELSVQQFLALFRAATLEPS
jgi:16S rRNA (adenine1518-N6/adenine1519-N6)-dimethyltransferase